MAWCKCWWRWSWCDPGVIIIVGACVCDPIDHIFAHTGKFNPKVKLLIFINLWWLMVNFLLSAVICASLYVSSKKLGQSRQMHTGYICSTVLFSNVSLSCPLQKRHSHIGCIFSTFHHCVFSNVSSNDLPEKRHNCIGCICLTFSDKWGFMKRRRESVNNHMCIAIDGFGQWKQKSSSSSGTAQQPTIEFAPVLAFKCTSIKVPIFLPTHHFAFSAGTHLNKPTKVRFLELSKL